MEVESVICIFKTFPININLTYSIKTSNFSITMFLMQNSNINNVL